MPRRITSLAIAFGCTGPAWAQGAGFQTPGMPGVGVPGSSSGSSSGLGQTTRFSNEFNPAFGIAIDGLLDYTDFDHSTEDDGFELTLRSVELSGAAWIDPKAWAYAVGSADESDVELEEAAVHYLGLGGNTTLRAGRFFVDFGKQMQSHVHDLRTVDRPAVLRTYLGEEVKGDGVEFDDWRPIGDEAAFRYSLGVFGDLITDDEEDDDEPLPAVEERKDFGELNFTGRLTSFRDVGEHGILQAGTSVEWIPDYAFDGEDGAGNDISVDGLDRTVWGLDLTYGLADETGTRRWTFGAEWLLSSGDVGAAFDATPPTAIDVVDDTVSGFYLFADRQWSAFDSAGVQWSALELPTLASETQNEVDLYITHALSEFQRLRFAVTWSDVEDGEESLRLAVQYTAFLGSHAHGINW